jgi:hypothetical protein
MDDELERETQSIERGAPVEARVDAAREKEGPGDDQVAAESAVGGEPRAWSGQDIDYEDVRTREEIGQVIADASFPASRSDLVRQAEEADAVDWVTSALRRLPDRRYENVEAVWEALGGPEEQRF